ncbi:hypothetical protein JCGZ_10316 [Jatropha curcas]|uniref:Aminotransferase-like plant mobile domain-containing protein n=1 Tax=Jatropha curcas TaxID=180498 RepID=A0A067KW38_JATCU|nr:hypothetical protein JCGZ_10316 [Jatropha curcas]
MHSWTRSLSKVEKINLGRYGLSPIITLRGVVVDWDFLRACIRLWDPEAYVFRFGTMMEEVSSRHTRVYLLGLTHCTWYCASRVLRQMGIDQTVPIVDDFSVDSATTPGVTRAVLRAWVRDHHMVRPLPNPAGVQTSPEYRTWFIDAVWPIELRRNALLSVLEGWVQADADHEVETDEEIVLAPRTGEVGESSAARDDSEDVAPQRRRDT